MASYHVYIFIIMLLFVYHFLIIFNKNAELRCHSDVPYREWMTTHSLEDRVFLGLGQDLWNDSYFEKLYDLDMYVRNAYFDQREEKRMLIRLWALLPRQTQGLFCHVVYSNGGHIGIDSVAGKLRQQDETVRPFCKYITGVVECPWTMSHTPLYVSVSSTSTDIYNKWHEVKVISLTPPSSSSAICMKTLFDFSDASAASLLEWFELNKILGVDRVIMYGYHNISDNVFRILKHYEKEMYLDLKPWTLPIETYTKNVYKIYQSDPVLRNKVKRMADNTSDLPCVRLVVHTNYTRSLNSRWQH